jgi:hypothetical protein
MSSSSQSSGNVEIAFADYLAAAFGCPALMTIDGRDSPHPRFVDAGTGGSRLRPPDHVTRDAIIVCRLDPARAAVADALRFVRQFLDRSPAAVIVSPATEDMRQPSAFRRLLHAHGIDVTFVGWCPDNDRGRQVLRLAAIAETTERPARLNAPADFRVVAFMPTYNDADIIDHSLRYLIDQGIGVHVIDNWSNDGTWERAQRLLGRGVVALERFPGDGPTSTYGWRRILGRVEALAGRVDADWCIVQDPDERRHAPWPDGDLRSALYHVDRSGFNCIDHLVLNFWPVEDRFDPALDVEQQLRFFTFSDHLGHYYQRRAWRSPHPVSLAPSAGHDVCFPGRLVYPFKFLLKHFPIRSQAQGERKVFADRPRRWDPEERALGWHQQYDEIRTGARLLRDRHTLHHFDERTFRETYLFERLSGIGVFRERPPWGTAPRQRFDGASQSPAEPRAAAPSEHSHL